MAPYPFRFIAKLGACIALLSGLAAAAGTQEENAFPETAGFDSLMVEDTTSIAGISGPSGLPPLLPARMGPMESLMWSENGWMRRAFDLPLTPEGRHEELMARRKMLALHQVGGFVTLAALAATVTLGQMAYNGNESMAGLHGPVALTAVAAYFTTASLAIFTPPPAIRRDEWSTVSTHKLLGTVHFSGMILTPLLGSMLESHRELRPVHLASAYVTTAALAGAMVAVTF